MAMGFLRRLFGGGSGGSPADKAGMYFYVRPKHCNEIVQVRVNVLNDLSESDDGESYFIRKAVRATRCPFASELYVTFDKNRRVLDIGVQDGVAVDEADYNAWLESKNQPAT
jgi:hypothetical protein